MKMTRQRELVLTQLRSATGFQSAQQIHADLLAAGHTIGLATVYRTLSALGAEAGVDELRTEEGETQYRYCETQKHHHHVVCRQCGGTAEIAGSGLEKFLASIAKEHNFTNLEHVIEVWGTCSTCRTA